MSGRSRHKSRGSDHLSSKNKKNKSRKRSFSESGDCVIETANRHSSVKDERPKSQKSKRGSSSSASNSSDLFTDRIKLDSQSHQLLGERLEFCRNEASCRANNRVGVSSRRSDRSGDRSNKKHCKERSAKVDPIERFPIIEHRARCTLMKERERGRRRVKEHEDIAVLNKKLNKSRKQRRSSSCSSYSTDSSSSRSSSSNSGSSSRSSSTSSSCERRKRRRKRKKLAKKMKRAEKKRREERRKLRKKKEESREPVNEIKQNIAKLTQDRLLKDINLELANRARVMAPMTKEEWEKKQSIIRRVYDGETGRHRLIKGDGEILEEIVSRNRHIEINRQATKGDGAFFTAHLGVNK